MRNPKSEIRNPNGQMARPESRGGEAATLTELRARGVVVITKPQMAAAIQVCPRTITEMMRRGEIAYYRIGKKLIRFRIEDAIEQMNKTVLVAAEEGEQ